MAEEKEYKDYHARDFIWDTRFRKWVLAPDAEQDSFWHSWMRENPKQKPAVHIAREALLALNIREPVLTDKDIKQLAGKILHTIHIREQGEKRVSSGVWPVKQLVWYVSAAIILLVAGFSIWFFAGQYNNSSVGYTDLVKLSANRLIEKVNSSDEPLSLFLEDGSKVVLQKNARISVAPSFVSTEQREVYLSGEASFDVAKNPSKPFIVYANGLITRVLGTSFTIRSDEAEEKVTVEVTSGIVSVYSLVDKTSHSDGDNKKLSSLILTRNQRAVYSVKDNSLIASVIENPASAKDVKINYNFSDTPIDSVFRAIQDSYGIDIIYDRKVFAQRTLTADLRNATMYQKLNIICKAANARYEVLDGKIVIYNNFD